MKKTVLGMQPRHTKRTEVKGSWEVGMVVEVKFEEKRIGSEV